MKPETRSTIELILRADSSVSSTHMQTIQAALEGTPSPPTPVKMISIRAAAELTSTSRWTIMRSVEAGELDAIKIGHRWRIPLTALQPQPAQETSRACPNNQ